MRTLSRPEATLLAAALAALAFACWGPVVTQHDHYHAFADQRTWLGIPCAMDVLSNLPFAVAGAWGLTMMALTRRLEWDGRRALAAVFFTGLLVTAVGSSIYHWQPDDWGLAWDRVGMVGAFAGLLGMAAADRISTRSGLWVAGLVLFAGPAAVAVWYTTANLTPWVVVQGGGMLLVLELGDHAVYTWTQGWVSGHSLKHLMAAMAAVPVLFVMHNVARVKLHRSACAPVQFSSL